MENLSLFTAILPAALIGAALGLLQSWKAGITGLGRAALWAVSGAVMGALLFMAIFIVRVP